MNNLREIMESLKRKGFCRCEPPVREAWQSRFANQRFANCVGGANLGSQTKGLRTALAEPISVRKPKVCELRWRKPISSFAPCGFNAENWEIGMSFKWYGIIQIIDFSLFLAI